MRRLLLFALAASVLAGALGCSQGAPGPSESSSATAPSPAPSASVTSSDNSAATAVASASAAPTASGAPSASATGPVGGAVAALLGEARANLANDDANWQKRVEVDGVVREVRRTQTGGSEGFKPYVQWEVWVTDPGAAAEAEALRCKMDWQAALSPGDAVTVTGTGRRDAPDLDGKNRDRFIVVPCVAKKRDGAKP